MDIDELSAILVPIACGCVLPIVMYWLYVREKMDKTKSRAQIVLAAIEKNPNMDLEELMEKISPKKKLLKEKLLTKLLWSSLTAMLGIGFIGFGAWLGYVGGGGSSDPMTCVCIGLIFLGVGIALFLNYHVGRKMLAKEIEAEERKLTIQA